MEDKDCIRITHYINPHMFWFKHESSYICNITEKEFQLEIDKYCMENYQKTFDTNPDYHPVVGEIVAVLHFQLNKWARCQVDQEIMAINGERSYNLWAIDEGIPVKSLSKWIKPLPTDLANRPNTTVKRGGLINILPAEMKYNYEKGTMALELSQNWSFGIVHLLQEIFEDASTIKFRNIQKFLIQNSLIYMGNMEMVTHTNINYQATDILKKTGPVKEVGTDEFIRELVKLKTLDIKRFQTNERVENMKYHKNARQPEFRAAMVTSREKNLQYDDDVGGVSRKKVQEWEQRNTAATILGEAEEDEFDDSVSMLQVAPVVVARTVAPKPNPAPTSAPTPAPTLEDADDEEYPLSEGTCGTNRGQLHRLLENTPRLPHSTFKPKPAASNLSGTSSREPELNKESGMAVLKRLQMKRALNRSKLAAEGTHRYATDSTINLFPAGCDLGNIEIKNDKACLNTSSSSDCQTPRPHAQDRKMPFRAKTNLPSDRDMNHSKAPTINGNNHHKNFERKIEDEKCIRSSLESQRVLVHGTRITKPIDNILSANFCEEVHTEMNGMRFNDIYRIQTYAWPHIMRGNSFFCVNPPKSGKTYAYLPAVCSSVKMKHDERGAATGAGPIAMIVCKSALDVQKIARQCKRLLNATQSGIQIIEGYGVRNDIKTCSLLLNGCDILVVTAPCYKRLYISMATAFCKSKLSIVVIDNIDMIIEHFVKELDMICKNTYKKNLQMIVTSNYWDPGYKGLLKNYHNMEVCIGAYIEAAVYANSIINFKLMSGCRKTNEIYEYIKDRYQDERTIIVCSETSEIEEIVTFLKSQSVFHISSSDKPMLDQIEAFKSWNVQIPGVMQVLICSDQHLSTLQINNAQHIIHYSLPLSWTKFTYRFAASFNYYKDPFNAEEANKAPASSLILLDEFNNTQLPKLIDFLQIHRKDVPEPIIRLTNKIKIQQEEANIKAKNSVEFCRNMSEFGKCLVRSCDSRHVFTPKDLPDTNALKDGVIKLNIEYVQSPTHYSARILEHKALGDTQWKTISSVEDYINFIIHFDRYFSDETQHQIQDDIVRDVICVVQDDTKYYRCKIIEIDDKRSSADKLVTVKLVDYGKTIRCSSSELLYLPEQFRSIPEQAIDIRICGIVPHDFELQWDSYATITAKKWIQEYGSQRFHVEARILLAIKGTIWVDTLRLVEHLKGISTYVNVIDFRKELLSKNFGTASPTNVVEVLSQMLEDCSLVDQQNKQINSSSTDTNDTQMSTDEATPSIQYNNSSLNESTVSTSTNETHRSRDEKPLIADRKDSMKKSSVEQSSCSFLDSDDYSAGHESCSNKIVSLVADRKDSIKMSSVEQSSNKLESSFLDSDDFSAGHESCSNGIESLATGQDPEEGHESSDSSEIEVIADSTINFDENYGELDGNFAEVCVSFYNSPSDFYVHVIDKMIELKNETEEYTGVANNLKRLNTVAVGQYCLILFDSFYNRAKIVEIEEKVITVFLLDSGGYEICEPDELYEIPQRLLTLGAFNAIKCKLAFIQPKSASDWTEEASHRIYDEVIGPCDKLFAKVVAAADKNTSFGVSFNCYKIMLLDGDSDNINELTDKIVAQGLASLDDDLLPIGFNEFGSLVYDSVELDHEICFDFTSEDINQMLGISGDNAIAECDESIPEEVPLEKCEAQIEEVDASMEANEQNLSKVFSGSKVIARMLHMKKHKAKPKKPAAMPGLKSSYMSPKTIWKQDDLFVNLKVSASDVKTYDIETDIDSFRLCFIKDNSSYMLLLNLFGGIRPEHTTHQIRGLNIIIRLVKLVEYMKWPSLSRHADKVQWLSHEYEFLSSDDEDVYKVPTVPYVGKYSSDDDSSSDEMDYDQLNDRFDPVDMLS